MINSLVAGLSIILVQDAPRDIKLPVMPIRQFGEWLEEQTGRDVIVLPQVQDKLIYINVKQRTLPELYQLVEKATAVEVLDKNGVLTLREDAGLERVGEMTAAGLQSSINKLNAKAFTEEEIRAKKPQYEQIQKKRETQGLSSSDPEWKDYMAMLAMDPMKIGVSQFLRAVGGQTLASLPLYENVVFSTQPTRMQRPWPGNAKQAMSELTDAMEVRNRAIATTKKEDKNVSYMVFDNVRMSQLFEIAGGNDQPVAALTARVQRMPYGVSVSLTSFDESGKGIVSAQEQVVDASFELAQSGAEPLKEKLAGLTKTYEMTDAEFHESQKLMAFFGGSNLGGSITREDIEWLANVDRVEPLSGVTTKLFDFAIEEAGSEIVTEVIMPYRLEQSRKTVSAGDMLGSLCTQSMVQITEPVIGGLMVGHPAPEWIRQYLVSRRSIAAIARNVLEKGKLTFDDLADGVSRLSSRDQMMLFVPAALHLSGQSDGMTYLQPRDWKEFMLIAYAQLTPEQRKKVFSEEGLFIELNRTNSDFQRIFWSTAMSTDIAMLSEYQEVDGQIKPVTEIGGMPVSDWSKQPTVFLTYPNAVPVRLHLVGSATDGLMIAQSHKQPGGQTFENTRFETVQNYASSRIWMELSPPTESYTPPTVTGVATANQISVQLSLNFGDFAIAPISFTMLGEPVGKLGPESELPKSIRDEMETLRAKLREDYQKYQRQNPPPP